MKLRNKILSVLGVGLVGLSASFYFASSALFSRSYTDLETQQLNQDVQRVLDAISKDLDNLSREVLDYSRWDDTYEFVAERNKDYIENNFANLYIKDLGLNAIVFVDASRQVVFAQGADLVNEEEVPVSPTLLERIRNSSLSNHPNIESQITGIIQLPEGPMLISSHPILQGDGSGPIRGSLIMGRYLNASYIQQLTELTRLPGIGIEPIDSPQLTADQQSIRQTLTDAATEQEPEIEESSIVVRPSSQDLIAGYSLLEDIDQNPVALLQVTEPRTIYAQGRSSLNYLVLATLLTGSIFSGLIILFLEKSVLSRLTRLNREVTESGTNRALSTRITLEGRDELAELATTFNAVLDQLQSSQTSLQTTTDLLQRQNRTIAELSHDESLIQGNLLQAVKIVVEATAETLGTDQVGVWLFNADQSQLTCLDSYNRATQQHTSGMTLDDTDYPQYFEPTQDNSVAVHESVLDVSIQNAGRRVGIIRCEQIGAWRQWKPEEQTFVYSIANLMALTLESEALQSEVGHILDTVSLVEGGDLTVQAQVSDRVTGLVADILNRLIERLAEVLNQVLDSAQQVSKNTTQQKELATTIAVNAEQQAQAITQILTVADRVEQAAQESAVRVQSSNAALRTAAQAIEQEQTAITTLTKRIDVLQDSTEQIVQQMKTLGEFVGLADQFVQDQSQVAFLIQTLSLNASLVAARASEQRDPRQFVVVAREFEAIAEQVRRLAQRTNEGLSTLEQRSSQIHTVFSVIDKNVQGLSELVKRFTEGVQQSYHVFSNVQAVTANTVQTGEDVAAFNQRIVESAQSTAQVVREIAETVANTADLTRVSQMQSNQINELATQLLTTVQFFQLPASSLSDEQERVDLSQVETTTVEVGATQDADQTSSGDEHYHAAQLPLSHAQS